MEKKERIIGRKKLRRKMGEEREKYRAEILRRKDRKRKRE